MPDSVSVVTTESWGSRLRGAFKGILFGLLLAALAAFVLFKNEGRAVSRYKALKEGGKEVISVAAGELADANEGKLVHTSGEARTTESLVDPEFGIVANAIHLEREVVMYQWLERTSSETKKKTGGGTETTTTYSYETGWSNRLVNSSSFKNPSGHQNPSSMPYSSTKVSARNVTLGAFTMSDNLVGQMNDWVDLPAQSTAGMKGGLAARARLHQGGIYIGADPAAPQIGDLRISFREVRPELVSVVARQAGPTLSPHQTRSGGTIALLRTGSATADEMFEAAQQANKVTTWVLRLVGFLMMVFGFALVLRPLSVLADVLPAVGNLVEKGVLLFAFAVALPVSLLIVAVAWIFYRPLLGITLLVLMGVAFVALFRRMRKARAEVAASPPPPPPPPPAPVEV